MQAESPRRRSAYDAIAHLYDADMARNMPFDDVAFYERACREAPGPILELGCGNGRVMLELLARGFDVTGVDASVRMLHALKAKAAARALPQPRVCLMDVRLLGLKPCFAVALCPYSLVTYMAGAGDAARLVEQARRVVVGGGRVIVNAFIPRPAAAGAEFRRDYERTYGAGVLVRSKRITPLSTTMNRIERRYEVIDAAGKMVERIETSEDIRPFAPDDVLTLFEAARLRVVSTWWDYASSSSRDDAQFFTAVAEVT